LMSGYRNRDRNRNRFSCFVVPAATQACGLLSFCSSDTHTSRCFSCSYALSVLNTECTLSNPQFTIFAKKYSYLTWGPAKYCGGICSSSTYWHCLSHCIHPGWWDKRKQKQKNIFWPVPRPHTYDAFLRLLTQFWPWKGISMCTCLCRIKNSASRHWPQLFWLFAPTAKTSNNTLCSLYKSLFSFYYNSHPVYPPRKKRNFSSSFWTCHLRSNSCNKLHNTYSV
jgi:hypothetical protein